MANIIEVAKLAGVGIATVSRVINHSGYVKKETRERVEKVIAEINYVPNEIARSMTLQRNNIIAFLLPDSIHRFFGELLYNVETVLYECGYKLIVCSSSERLEKEIVYIDMLKTNRVDAIILLTNNDVEPYLDKSLPLVSFDRRFEGVPFVASDNFHGGVLAARHLLSVGCKHFMFIGDDAQGEHTAVMTEVSKRRIGFFEELAQNGVTDIINVEYPLGNYIHIPEDIHQKIDLHREVDGIFCISDAVAAEVVINIEKKGRRVPEDVKVIGYDGGQSFLNLGKRITSINQPPRARAEAIVEIIQARLNKQFIEKRIVPVELAKGGTA